MEGGREGGREGERDGGREEEEEGGRERVVSLNRTEMSSFDVYIITCTVHGLYLANQRRRHSEVVFSRYDPGPSR